MPKNTSSLGRKRPLVNIPLELLDFDPDNPRLAKEYRGSSQFDLLQVLNEQFNLEELAYSMSENGYFDEEPLVVIPHKVPKEFKSLDTIEEQQKLLNALIEKKEIRFIVVEGNRRTATLKLLVDSDLRRRLKIDTNFPKPKTQKIFDDLTVLPAIFYTERSDISAYLGVRHITGLLKWDAYAKAVYIASRIEEGVKKDQGIDESIREVQRQTSDRSDVIKKQYLCYKVLKEAETDLNFDINDIKDRFSLITVALNSPSIREFIGAPSYKDADFSKRIIPNKKLNNLEKLLTWIYGNGKDKTAILTDSRKISSRLAPVLSYQESTEYLLKYENLEDAYERSGGEKDYLIKKINDATRNLRSALSIAYRYREDDILQLVDDCIDAAEELKKMVVK